MFFMKSALSNWYRLAFVLFLISTVSNAQEYSVDKSLNTNINNYLDEANSKGFSGNIVVFQGGELVIRKDYGFANKDSSSRISSNTIFDIGSNTKQFTAAAILKLVQENKLSLSDSLGLFFNDLPSDKGKITIHQLLTHTAGFVRALGSDFEQISTGDFFKILFKSKLIFSPGTQYSYSNPGYSVLARVIELISYQSYEEFIREQLFIPLKMYNTGYLIPKWNQKDISIGYKNNIVDKGSMISKYKRSESVSWHLIGNGGINSTQNDMILWFQSLMQGKVINKEYLSEIIKPHVNNANDNNYYGYGWRIAHEVQNKLKIFHDGGNGIFSHSLIFYPSEEVFIVFATNTSSRETESIGHEVGKMVLNKKYTPKPIRKNVYEYIFNYVRDYKTCNSAELFSFLEKYYNEAFISPSTFNGVGNFLLKEGNHNSWALELFKMNVLNFPENGNLWDSLGDGFVANKLFFHAKVSYQKAIDLGYKGAERKLSELAKN